MTKKKNNPNKKKDPPFNFPQFNNSTPVPQKSTPSNDQTTATTALPSVVDNPPAPVEQEKKEEIQIPSSPARNNFEGNDYEDKENALIGKTVFDDPENYTIKYPLKNRWTFWFDKPSKNNKAETWGDHLEKIYTFGHIEDFWGLYNNIEPVTRLAPQSNYHLFREGIVPKWEDPMNENGGRWVVFLEKEKSNPNSSRVIEYFLKSMLACIGELITPYEDEICGVVVSVKPSEDRISLWCYSTPEDSSICRECGKRFKQLLELPEDNKVIFYSFKQNTRMGTVPANPNYVV